MTLLPQLIALVASISFAGCFIAARRGMQFSTPITVTLVALIVHSVTLWTGVFLIGGIPEVDPTALFLFVLVGILMAVTRLLSFMGIEKIGAAKASSLRSTFPIFSVLIAITILGEEASIPVLAGAGLVVVGIIVGIIYYRGARVSG